MTRSSPWLVALLVVAGCDLGLRAEPPHRDSDRLVPLAGRAVVRVLDQLSPEPVWIDAADGRVRRLRAGEIELVQPDPIPRAADPRVFPRFRVMPDGVVAAIRRTVWIRPHGAEPLALDIGLDEVAIDGSSVDDLWIVGRTDAASDDPYTTSACRVLAGQIDRCVPLGRILSHPEVAIGPGGTVYVAERTGTLFRLEGDAWTPLRGIQLTGFRRGPTTLLGISASGETYAMEGGAALSLADGPDLRFWFEPTMVVPRSDGMYFATHESEQVNVDPDCRDGFGFGNPCAKRDLWTQLVVYRVAGGRVEEVAHEDCTDARRPACERSFAGIAVDAGRVVILGAPLRALPSPR